MSRAGKVTPAVVAMASVFWVLLNGNTGAINRFVAFFSDRTDVEIRHAPAPLSLLTPHILCSRSTNMWGVNVRSGASPIACQIE